MGELTELANSHGYKSLRSLAKALKDSEHWPSGEKLDLETVANRLREADKGTNTKWWTEGKGRPFLKALAELLQEDESDLIEKLQRGHSTADSDTPALWPFRVLPALRSLDLRSEDLYPGLPPQIARRDGPREARTWWVASPGAGRTLVGRWLEHRGWTFLQASQWADLELPQRGRVFVDLASTDGLTATALTSLPETLKLCVACPSPPPASPDKKADTTSAPSNDRSPPSEASTEEDAAAPKFGIVYSPPAQEWALRLIQWVAGRIRPDGGFDRERLTRMFRDPGMASWFETPGDLLAFLGMVDEVGLDGLDDSPQPATDPLRWVRAWLKALLGRPDRRLSAEVVTLLEKQGPQILLDMEVQRLRRDLAPALPEATWIDLIPRSQAPELDRERLLAALDEPDGDVRTRMRTMLAPDGASIVASLRAAGVLVENASGGLRLRPAWVANVLFTAAIDRLYQDAPEGLGALLLTSNTSEFVLRRLIAAVRTGDIDLVTRCVQPLTHAPSPEQLAAINGAFRAIGIALADGAKLPLALVRAAWEHQMPFVFAASPTSAPAPFLNVGAMNHAPDAPTSIGAWHLAALALSRALVDAGIAIDVPALNPWGGFPPDSNQRVACTEALDFASRAFHSHDDFAHRDPLQLSVYRLGGSLFDRCGPVRRMQRLLGLQGPDLLVMLATGVELDLTQEEREELLHLSFGLAALTDACQRRGAPIEDVLAWCWSMWNNARGYWPPTEWARRKPIPHPELTQIWKATATVAISDKICDLLVQQPQAFPFLTEAAWARCVEVWGDWTADALRFVPQGLALEAMRNGGLEPRRHDSRRILWERMPDALLGLIDELARVRPRPDPKRPNHAGPLWDLIISAPAGHCRAIVEQARAWMAAPASYPGVGGWLRWWLSRTVDQRTLGWRDAYELLLAVHDPSAVNALLRRLEER